MDRGTNGGMDFVLPGRNSGGGVVRVYRGGTIRGLSRGARGAAERVSILGRLGRLLGLPRIPRVVRTCSVSGVSNSGGITNVVIFGSTGPCGTTCGQFGVGNFSKRSSCESVTRILSQHFGRCLGNGGREFGDLPSLVLLSNTGKRVNTILPVVRGCKLGVPVFNVIGSSGRHAHTVTAANNSVMVGSGQHIFALVAGVRSRIRQFTVDCRGTITTGGVLKHRLAGVGNVNSGGTGTLLGRFNDVAGVGSTSGSVLLRMGKVDTGGTRSVIRFFGGLWAGGLAGGFRCSVVSLLGFAGL